MLVVMCLIAEKKQAKTTVKEAARATPTTTPSQSDVRPKQKGLTDQLQLLEVGGGKKDILIAVHAEGENSGVWILEGSQWVKRGEIPRDLPQTGVFFCAVADGLVIRGTTNKQKGPVCYYYSLSQGRWKKLPDMITPRSKAEAVEISPMLVMVVSGFDKKDTNNCEILDIKQGKWSSVKPLPRHMKLIRVAATDGRVFIMGQYGDRNAPKYELHEYHSSSDAYTKVQIHIPGSDALEFDLSGMVALAGKVYLVGQINIEYDITTQHVTQLPKPKAIYGGCCATVRGKNILLCGGRDTEHWKNAMEEYNTTTRQWKMLDVSLPYEFSKTKSFVANISM